MERKLLDLNLDEQLRGSDGYTPIIVSIIHRCETEENVSDRRLSASLHYTSSTSYIYIHVRIFVCVRSWIPSYRRYQ